MFLLHYDLVTREKQAVVPQMILFKTSHDAKIVGCVACLQKQLAPLEEAIHGFLAPFYPALVRHNEVIDPDLRVHRRGTLVPL